MTSTGPGARTAGLWGPVALFGGLLLLLASPVMRGGNRYVALVPLEFLGLLVLLALWARWLGLRRHEPSEFPHKPLLALLLLSPLILAIFQLVPLPAGLWGNLPGHSIYSETLKDIGASVTDWRPLSVSPDATAASLLAAIPIVAALLLGLSASLSQLRMMLRLVVGVAFAEVLLGLMQISGGQHSSLFFGVMTYGPPVGTFANRNHFANYIGMALAAYIWLAYEANRVARSKHEQYAFGSGHRTALWVAGGLVLVLGILMSRSRGGLAFGLPLAVVGLGVVSLRRIGWSGAWRFAVPVTLVLLIGAGALIGFDAVTSRVSGDQLATSAGFRTLLARTSVEGALAFLPWGSGWGTYDLAYQRFQPAAISGYANHAHQDYVEMLFEGGIFFLLFATAFLWLAGRRAHLLVRRALRDRTLDREAMAATLCGLGLLGLLLHSLVEFNMRIPANAILGALLAGAYLRPLGLEKPVHDRSAQPHPARR